MARKPSRDVASHCQLPEGTLVNGYQGETILCLCTLIYQLISILVAPCANTVIQDVDTDEDLKAGKARNNSFVEACICAMRYQLCP